MTHTFSNWPSFTEVEAQIVQRILLSNKVNYWNGQEGRMFEAEFAEFAETKHAIALANGTLAMDLALHGLGIGQHNGGSETDEVIVTPRSFIASVSSIVNAGARPMFADVDRESGNITGDTVAQVITKETRAVLCVHLAGWPCDMDGIRAAIGSRDVALIEDCAQAHGAEYKGRPVGGLGDVSAWSFCQDKIMSTGGEGGMVACNDEVLWRRMWAFKDHGKSWEAVYEREHPPGFRWLHESFGSNWRLTEIQSGIGRYQLECMPEWSAKRADNAKFITQTLIPFADDGPIRIVDPRLGGNDDIKHAWYKYYAYVRHDRLSDGWSRDRIVTELTDQGVACFQGSCSEIYLEKAFDGTKLRPKKRLQTARELGETSLMFLVHPTLTDKDMAALEIAMTNVLRAAAR